MPSSDSPECNMALACVLPQLNMCYSNTVPYIRGHLCGAARADVVLQTCHTILLHVTGTSANTSTG